VDDEWTETLTMATVAHFSSACTEFSGCIDFENIVVCIHPTEKNNSFLCLCKVGEVGVRNDERDLKDLFNAMPAG
jgi:hypothetical protein